MLWSHSCMHVWTVADQVCVCVSSEPLDRKEPHLSVHVLHPLVISHVSTIQHFFVRLSQVKSSNEISAEKKREKAGTRRQER